jgi:hypothetical protein
MDCLAEVGEVFPQDVTVLRYYPAESPDVIRKNYKKDELLDVIDNRWVLQYYRMPVLRIHIPHPFFEQSFGFWAAVIVTDAHTKESGSCSNNE